MPDTRRARLTARLSAPGITVVPGVTDAFQARLAHRAGFEVLFTTGAGLANTMLGEPDIGLTTMTEIVTATRRIADSVPVPIIADADTGYGNHLNAMRTMREMEHAGVAAIVIEDQVAPKRCGHFEGKRVVPAQEMVEKLVAVRAARRDPELAIIARTDAVAVEGLSGALERARAYVEAGADVIFVEAPRSEAELTAIPQAVSVPCLVNMVEGGVTPIVGAGRLQEMGFKLVVHANLALRAAARAVADAFATLRREGTTTGLLDTILPWAERQEIVGLDAWRAVEEDVLRRAHGLGEGRYRR